MGPRKVHKPSAMTNVSGTITKPDHDRTQGPVAGWMTATRRRLHIAQHQCSCSFVTWAIGRSTSQQHITKQDALPDQSANKCHYFVFLSLPASVLELHPRTLVAADHSAVPSGSDRAASVPRMCSAAAIRETCFPARCHRQARAQSKCRSRRG